MTDNPCNCSTCTIKREVLLEGKIDYTDYRPYPYATSYFRCLVDDHIVEGDEYIQICKRGCLSHSTAREWLMKDVILELKLLQSEGRISLNISDAINLIENGVRNNDKNKTT